MRRAIVTCLAIGLSSIVPANDATACTIILSVGTLPGASLAPLNTHVWFSAEMLYDLTGSPGKPAGASFILRPSGTNGESDSVMSAFRSGEALELVPREPLLPRHGYDVWFVGKDRKQSPTSRLAVSFKTGDGVDTTPPPKVAIKSASVSDPKGRIAICGNTFDMELEGARAQDVGGGPVLLAAWVSDASGTIHYDAQPLAIIAQEEMAYIYNGLRFCPEADLTCKQDFITWIRARKIGIRAFDAAGNMSEPTELPIAIH